MNCLPVPSELSRETETIHLDILIAIFHCHDIVIIFYSCAVTGKKIIPLRQIVWEALAWDMSLLLHHDVSEYLQTAKVFPFNLLQAQYVWFPQFAAWFSDTLDVCFWCLLFCLWPTVFIAAVFWLFVTPKDKFFRWHAAKPVLHFELET